MSALLDFAEGPLFRVAFLLFALGTLRLVVLGILTARKRPDPLDPRFSTVRGAALGWLVPVRSVHPYTPLHTVSSVLMHVGILVIPFALADHVARLTAGTTLTLPVLPAGLADPITLISMGSIMALVSIRLLHPPSRAGTDVVDHLFLGLLGFCFFSGYLASHPEQAPVSWQVMLLLHVVSAEAILALIPFSRMSHFVLSPSRRIAAARTGRAFGAVEPRRKREEVTP